MNVASLVSPMVDIVTPQQRVWRAAPIDRALAWRVGLLQTALGIVREEAGQVAGLLHLDPASRAEVLAQADAAQESPPATGGVETALGLSRYDEIVCGCVRGLCLPDGGEVQVELVLQQDQADAQSSPERVWVGALPMMEVCALGAALIKHWQNEVRVGTTFRAELGAPSTAR